MRQPKIALILAVAVIGIFASCLQSSVEIYFSPNGNGKASGTREQYILTFKKANEQLASLCGKKKHMLSLKMEKEKF